MIDKNDVETLIKIIKEKNRRNEQEKLKSYNTGDAVHKKQLEFHKDKSRIRWIFGGNRTGKTVAGAVEVVWYARGNHPYKQIGRATCGLVVSLTNEVQRDVAQKEILKWLNSSWIEQIYVKKGQKGDPKNAIIDYITVKSIFGGLSIVSFKNCEQGREKFQGTSQDYVWFDEEPPREIFEECKMRVLDTCGDIWGTMTPLKGLTFVYDLIYLNKNNDKNIKYFVMEWADNPFLSKTEVESFVKNMSEEERESRQYGRFMSACGLVYKEFDEDIHIIEPFDVPYEWYDNISIDPGLSAPLSCHFYACDGDGNVFVIAEHYEAEKSIDYHCEKILQIAQELNWKKTRNGYIEALIDSAANQKTLASEKSVAELFRENGIWAVTNVDKSKWAGIQRVKSYLAVRESEDKKRYPKGKPRLFIFKNCPNMISEIKSYRWKENSDEPIKKNDHSLDELRYYIMSKPEPYKASCNLEQSLIEKHKKKMERVNKRRKL